MTSLGTPLSLYARLSLLGFPVRARLVATVDRGAHDEAIAAVAREFPGALLIRESAIRPHGPVELTWDLAPGGAPGPAADIGSAASTEEDSGS